MVSTGLLALIAARVKRIKYVFWMSNLMSESRIYSARERIHNREGFRYRLVYLKGVVERFILYRVILPYADHVFVQSDKMLEFVTARGIPASKQTAVPMAVDCEVLVANDILTRLPAVPGRPVIAYLGTLDRMRKLGCLVDVLARVRARYPNAHLMFIGDAETARDRAEILDRAQALGLCEGVTITGWLPTHEALAMLKGADVAISYFPRNDILDTNSPTKVLEYLALGIPCVGNDNPDQAKVLRESGAGLLTGSDVDEMAEGVMACLDDMPAARQRAKKGPAYIASTRNYQALSEELVKSYRSMLINS